MGKRYTVGDIHGSYLGLKQVLDRCNFDYQEDLLISLGDIADGWSQVPECVDELLKIKNLISIRGNHDVWCWNWFTFGDRPTIWTQQGGMATIEAYLRTGQVVDKAHKAFWDNQIDYYIDDENRLFVHGGFELYEGFKDTKQIKVNMHRHSMYHWSRDLADGGETSGEYEAKINEFKEIYIGHTAHNSTNYKNKFYNIYNLDSGAGWSGFLTLMDIDTKETYVSDKTSVLYPKEKGRR